MENPGTGRNPNAPSVDRIDSSRGYTVDNCRLILWSLNRALNNYGEGYIFKIFRAVFAHQKRQRKKLCSSSQLTMAMMLDQPTLGSA